MKELNITVYERLHILDKRIRSREYLVSKIAAVNDTILLHGGGNFGDLYRNQNKLRANLMRVFPKNKFIIFPQTIFYRNQSLAIADSNELAAVADLTIVTRSRQSFKFAKKTFTNNKIFLVPDMAFMIGPIEPVQKPIVDIFVLRRVDLEKNFAGNQWTDILKAKLTVGRNISYMVNFYIFKLFTVFNPVVNY